MTKVFKWVDLFFKEYAVVVVLTDAGVRITPPDESIPRAVWEKITSWVKDQDPLYKIEAFNDSAGRADYVMERNIRGREAAVKRMVEIAREQAGKFPNNPTVDQSGVDEVSIWCAQYRVRAFRAVPQ